MAKKQSTLYVCSNCSATYQKWLGRCPECNEWNTIDKLVHNNDSKQNININEHVVNLLNCEYQTLKRYTTSIKEFDLVCGGGLVPGSIILLGGEPGIGKSTLALQIASDISTLYCTGEETFNQIYLRASRININSDNINITTQTTVENIISIIEKLKPELVIIDSIQTIYSGDIESPPGSVSQIKYCTTKLSNFIKQTSITLILIGHITKDGSIAGPKLLEHLVDTVLYFEGDFNKDYRILRAFKNRYGSINEIALFNMTSKGLVEVEDKSALFIQSKAKGFPGSILSSTIEGTRPIVFEVQSLVTPTAYSNPRRMADGFDVNRLNLLVAVIEKHAKIQLGAFDIFINIAGGLNINDTSCDTAIAMAIISSLKNISIPHNYGVIGELSLSGEIRPVKQPAKRINEMYNAGIDNIIISTMDYKKNNFELKNFKGKIIPLNSISEINEIFEKFLK